MYTGVGMEEFISVRDFFFFFFLVKDHFCQSAHSKFATNYLNISQSMRSKKKKKKQYLAKVGNVHQGLLQMCIALAVLNENLFCSGSRPEQLNASAKKTCHRESGKPNKGVPHFNAYRKRCF